MKALIQVNTVVKAENEQLAYQKGMALVNFFEARDFQNIRLHGIEEIEVNVQNIHFYSLHLTFQIYL